MAVPRMDAAVGHEAEQTERRAGPFRLLHRVGEGRVGKGSVGQGAVDAEEVLRDHPPGPEVQAADLGVAHEPRREPDSLPGGLEGRERKLPPPAVERRRGASARVMAFPSDAGLPPSRRRLRARLSGPA